MTKTKSIHDIGIQDFTLEVVTDDISTSMQILYLDKPAAGMSEFGGTFRSAKDGMVAFLRRLADGVKAIELDNGEQS